MRRRNTTQTTFLEDAHLICALQHARGRAQRQRGGCNALQPQTQLSKSGFDTRILGLGLGFSPTLNPENVRIKNPYFIRESGKTKSLYSEILTVDQHDLRMAQGQEW
jgi:hypothetical protein